MSKIKEKLPKKFKEKWVKALRSGDYGQITGYLHQDNSNKKFGDMCCLGVACHITGSKIKDFKKFEFPKKNK